MFALMSTYDTNSAERSRVFRLAHSGALPLGHVLLGLLDGAFKLQRKFQFVFDVVIKPVAILLQLTREITEHTEKNILFSDLRGLRVLRNEILGRNSRQSVSADSGRDSLNSSRLDGVCVV